MSGRFTWWTTLCSSKLHTEAKLIVPRPIWHPGRHGILDVVNRNLRSHTYGNPTATATPLPGTQGRVVFLNDPLGRSTTKKRIKTIPLGITTLGGIPPIYSYLFHSGNSKGGFKTNPSEKSQDHKHSVQKTTSSIQKHATWLLRFHVMTSKRIHSCA